MINMPEVGLGTTVFWNRNEDAEEAMGRAVNEGLVSLIDTAEMYGTGRSEEALGRVLSRCRREDIYLVDKILPDNATKEGFGRSLKRSLMRLGTDYIDLYLLHWREKADLAFVADAMNDAVKEGLILHWGVSNFDVSDMEDLFAVEHGSDCCVDQVLYNICHRGIEYDLLPWLKEHDVRPMSYSTLGSASTGDLKRCECNEHIRRIGEEMGLSPAAIMLAFDLRTHDLTALFSSSTYQHIVSDLKGLYADLDPYMAELDKSFPAPCGKVPLEKI